MSIEKTTILIENEKLIEMSENELETLIGEALAEKFYDFLDKQFDMDLNSASGIKKPRGLLGE